MPVPFGYREEFSWKLTSLASLNIVKFISEVRLHGVDKS